MKKSLSVLVIGLAVVGCKKEEGTQTAAPPTPPVPTVPAKPAAATPTPSTKDQAALATYADFVKETKQLKARLASGMTHEEFDKKVGSLIDAQSLIDDSDSALAQKAKTVVEKARNAQEYWNGQDRVGVSDPKALPQFLTWVGNAVDEFQKAYTARLGR